MTTEHPPVTDALIRAFCSWITPSTIATVAQDLRRNPVAARARRDAAWAEDDGLDARSTGIEWLTRGFLGRFRLPEDMIELAAALAPDAFNESVRSDLLSLRFRGDVLMPGESDDLATGALIGVMAEHVTVLLVTRPLSVVIEKALEIVKVYRRAVSTIPHEFLTFEHFQPEPFATYIELVVAQSFLGTRLMSHPFRAERLRRQAFPAFNLVSRAPVPPALLSEARETAHRMARANYEKLGKPELP